MRDQGLEQAIKVAGGVASLAKALGIAQPSVSGWSKVPVDRLQAVEAATQVPRSVLRPDLFETATSDAGSAAPVDEIDLLRAAEYSLLATLLRMAPTTDLLARLATVSGDGTELGLAHIALAEAATATDASAVSREYFDLFVGLGRGEFLPYASYYLTGFLHERPLARVREDFARIGIERAGSGREPEDHIATLCEVMAGFARGELAGDATVQATFFDRHLKPWASRFFAELALSRTATFYRTVGHVGRVFMELEREAFLLPG